jgi:hypothetical protein
MSLRRLGVLSAGFLALWTLRCGAPQRSTPSDSTGGQIDAGAPGSEASDAGAPGSGGSDAGSALDAGLDGGRVLELPPPDARVVPGPDAASVECRGLLPSSAGRGQVYESAYAPYNAGYCGLPQGDGKGLIALERSDSDHPSWDVIDPSGHLVGSFNPWWGNAFPTPDGFIGESQAAGRFTVGIARFTGPGKGQLTAVRGIGLPAPDPNGGILLAGRYSGQETVAPAPSVWMFNADASLRWGPTPITGDATVVGAGVDTLGRSIVLLGGAPGSGAGPVTAQWFATDGRPLGEAFEILHDFSPDVLTRFETSPLIGGGVALRRVHGIDPPWASDWVGMIGSGASHIDLPPKWLASRPNTRLEVARGESAYAVLPYGEGVAPCSQSAEVLTPSGVSCGALELPIVPGACITRDLRLGLDGSVLQMVPSSLEHDLHQPGGPRSCTLRFWPAVLR